VDTVALVSVIASGAVAIVVASLSTFAAVREGRAAREHERRLARDTRLFDRRADAYESMMAYCEMHMQTVESRCPVFSPGPDAPNIPIDAEEKMALRGSFSTYASPEAEEALDAFLNQTLAFYVRADVYERAKEQGSPIGGSGKEMHDAREKARARFTELRAQIRDELAAV
jgi:hypothetical protein